MRVQLRRKQAFVVEIHPFQRAPAADDAAVSTLVDVYNFGRTTAAWIGFEANRHESRAYLARAIVTPPLRAPIPRASKTQPGPESTRATLANAPLKGIHLNGQKGLIVHLDSSSTLHV